MKSLKSLIGNRVLIKPLPEEEKTSAGGIVIPTTVKTNVGRAEVKQVGEVKWVKEGDIVLYSLTAGTEITVDNERHIMVFEDAHEILAVI